MIRSFRDATTKALFNDEDAPRFRAIERVARRKLLYLHQAKRLERTSGSRPAIGSKRYGATAGGNTASASTTSGGSAFAGRTEMLMTSRLSITTEVRYGRETKAP